MKYLPLEIMQSPNNKSNIVNTPKVIRLLPSSINKLYIYIYTNYINKHCIYRWMFGI